MSSPPKAGSGMSCLPTAAGWPRTSWCPPSTPGRLFGRLVAHPSTRQVLARMDRSPTALPPEVTHLGLAGEVPVLPGRPFCTATPWWSYARTAPPRTAKQPGRSCAGRAGPAPRPGTSSTCSAPADSTCAPTWSPGSTARRISTRSSTTSGSPYGLAWSGMNTLYARASTASPVEGLFCVGAAAHPGAGLPFVGLGAALAAQLIGPAERVRG